MPAFGAMTVDDSKRIPGTVNPAPDLPRPTLIAHVRKTPSHGEAEALCFYLGLQKMEGHLPAGEPDIFEFDLHALEPFGKMAAIHAILDAHDVFEWEKFGIRTFLDWAADKESPPTYYISKEKEQKPVSAWGSLSPLFQFPDGNPFTATHLFDGDKGMTTSETVFHRVCAHFGRGTPVSIEEDLKALVWLFEKLPTLDLGLDFNNPLDPRLLPPLLNALYHRNLHVARVLVERGANLLGTVDYHGNTLDAWACLLRSPKVIAPFLSQIKQGELAWLHSLVAHPAGEGRTALLKDVPFPDPMELAFLLGEWGKTDKAISRQLESWAWDQHVAQVYQQLDRQLEKAGGVRSTARRL
jgi:hypothetical protein